MDFEQLKEDMLDKYGVEHGYKSSDMSKAKKDAMTVIEVSINISIDILKEYEKRKND